MDSEVSKDNFQINDFVVYPSHGVGNIVDEEIQSIAGFELSKCMSLPSKRIR